MISRSILLCFTTLVFAWNAAATSSAQCQTPEQCKSIMTHGFNMEYRTSLIRFLSENLYAIENAAIELKDGYPTGDDNRVKLTAIVEGTKEQREIIENSGELGNEKVSQVMKKVTHYWDELTTMNTDKSKIQPNLNRVAKAWRTFCESVVQSWLQASIIAKTTDSSQISGYDGIDADVKKIQNLSATAENQNVYMELMGRILQFFGVQKSLIYEYNL